MKRILTTLSIILLAISFSYSQNPERTKKIQKQAKKLSRKQSDIAHPYSLPPKDGDDDGVEDVNDKCPGEGKRGAVTPFGCPIDTDFDGLYDYEDSCVTLPGPKENRGCPYGDKDNDGILDKDDKCPDQFGLAKFEGCPDTDGDGIQDAQDACPKVFGVKELNGCPYTDTDGDGILDKDDLCPTRKGVKENRGCPPIKEEEIKALKKAFDNLLFETGKDVIMPSSFAALNDLAAIMIKNSASKLHLEGHTDNVGNDANNFDLSERRAKSVKTYLANKGVAEERITSAGYGESRPKTTNETAAGRQTNRRVEMNIAYE